MKEPVESFEVSDAFFRAHGLAEIGRRLPVFQVDPAFHRHPHGNGFCKHQSAEYLLVIDEGEYQFLDATDLAAQSFMAGDLLFGDDAAEFFGHAVIGLIDISSLFEEHRFDIGQEAPVELHFPVLQQGYELIGQPLPVFLAAPRDEEIPERVKAPSLVAPPQGVVGFKGESDDGAPVLFRAGMLFDDAAVDLFEIIFDLPEIAHEFVAEAGEEFQAFLHLGVIVPVHDAEFEGADLLFDGGFAVLKDLESAGAVVVGVFHDIPERVHQEAEAAFGADECAGLQGLQPLENLFSMCAELVADLAVGVLDILQDASLHP